MEYCIKKLNCCIIVNIDVVFFLYLILGYCIFLSICYGLIVIINIDYCLGFMMLFRSDNYYLGVVFIRVSVI